MSIDPYLFFNGRCEEAITFYRQAVGAETTMLMRFRDCPPGMPRPPDDDKIMHAHVVIGGSAVLMSDGECKGETSFSGFSLTLNVADEAAATTTFAALSDGGTVTMPLGPTFFAASFGMLTDRFGVGWMVMAPPTQS